MAIDEFKVEFLKRIQRTPSAISYRFSIPEGFVFAAGQYMFVDLGEKLVHPLSFSDCPEETGFIEFTKRMTGSPYCRRLESLEKGERVTVKGPMGHFCCDASESALVMVAGGIGITPIRSVLRSCERMGESRPITLVYGNLNRADIAFREEFENLQLPGFRLVHALTDTTGMENVYQGFITADIISRELSKYKEAFYMVSGPPVMVEAIKKELASLDIPEEQTCFDLFMGY